MKTTQKFTWIV